IQSSIAWTLGATFENLVLTGSANINGTGNASANSLTGNAGNNILDGGLGADAMAGGAGNDTFLVDNAGDTVSENAGEGADTVQSSVSFTLGANIEGLTLTGTANLNATGNDIANALNGNAGNNVLNGGLGADVMTGGDGDDIYLVDNSGDKANEVSATGGNDLVQSSVSFALGANVKRLTLTGTGNITAVGNALNNVLLGNSGNNTLSGGAGADTMTGGLGNDTYLVDDAGDVVTEASGAGTDTVQSAITYTLGANLEVLTLTGTANINGTGNALGNSLNGNAGANVLDGGGGADLMFGGNGDDVYIVSDLGDRATEVSAAGGYDTV